jgi:cytochrome c biogenesis protein CcmG, thiol:disulfide interchange protein DsbE
MTPCRLVARRVLIALASIAVAVAVVVGLTQTSGSTSAPKPAAVNPAVTRSRLAGAPAPLAALHAQSSRLLPGGRAAVRARLDRLKGYPVIVNKWASWCGPCRAEFPYFQRLGVSYGKRVAFMGLDAGDNDADARRFLRRFPVAYPSYRDPNEKAALALGIATYYPTTVFYGRDGHREFIHQGYYLSEAKLRSDIERYALGS